MCTYNGLKYFFNVLVTKEINHVRPLQNKSRVVPNVTSSSGTYSQKFSQKFPIRGLEVEDMNETRAMAYGASPDDARLMFELDPKRDQPKLVFKAESSEEKAAWMSSLLLLITRPLLERNLDSVLQEEKQPLRLPPPVGSEKNPIMPLFTHKNS